MVFKQNLSTTDRWLRFALAFWWLSPMAPHFQMPILNIAIAVVAWWALLEVFVGWCAFQHVCSIDNHNK